MHDDDITRLCIRYAHDILFDIFGFPVLGIDIPHRKRHGNIHEHASTDGSIWRTKQYWIAADSRIDRLIGLIEFVLYRSSRELRECSMRK
jgi:hypothetical protein